MSFEVITALITPFFKSGKVNYKGLCSLIDYQLKNEIDTFVIFGTTGEGATISNKEKYHIIKKLNNDYGLLINLIVGVSQIDTLLAIEEVKYLSKLKIQGFLVLSPTYLKTNEQGVINHFLKIAESTSFLVYLYYIPKRTGQSFSPEILKILKQQKNIRGIKDASNSKKYFEHLLTFQDLNFQIYSGEDVSLMEIIKNADGLVSVISNAYPKTIKDIVKLYESNYLDEAQCLFDKISKMMELLFLEPNPIPIKYLMSRILFLTNNYHLPLYYPSEELKQMIDEEMRRLNNEDFIDR